MSFLLCSCRAMFHCNNCQRDISNCVRIRCAECTDFDLCLPCFSVGVNIYPHRNDHEYRVVDNLAFPIFHPDWGVSQLSPSAMTAYPKSCKVLSCSSVITSMPRQYPLLCIPAATAILCQMLCALPLQPETGVKIRPSH